MRPTDKTQVDASNPKRVNNTRLISPKPFKHHDSTANPKILTLQTHQPHDSYHHHHLPIHRLDPVGAEA